MANVDPQLLTCALSDVGNVITPRCRLSYAHLVELGTKPGTRRTKKTAFRIFGRGEEVVTREISHGGTKAQPFIRKAFDNKYNKANAKMRERLLKGFDEILGNYLGK